MKTFFVDVITPHSVPNLFTYRVPNELAGQIMVGQRVLVPFGKGNKLFTGLIANIHENAPTAYTAKYIDSVLDSFPIVNDYQLKLWKWMSEYYLCNLGDLFNAALPSSLKLQSESKFSLAQDVNVSPERYTDEEYLIIEALQLNPVLTIDEVSDILQKKTVQPIIKTLIEKRAIIVSEEIKEKYQPKLKPYVRLTENADNEEKLEVIFTQLEKRATKQLELLTAFIQLSDRYRKKDELVPKKKLLAHAQSSEGILTQLVKKEILEILYQEVDRISEYIGDVKTIPDLSEAQASAFAEVKEHFKKHEVTLLHGVTSSGKTEIYAHLIQEAIQQGKEVLYLVPEIALTTQLIKRLQFYFGDNVFVYHSHFNQNERAEIWGKVLNNKEGKVIVGARSAMFLPFSNLQLIIVDEEHDTSYKQYEPAPRYNARDSSIVLANLHQAKVLLGSATPSIESYTNATNDKYGLVTLTKRFGNIEMPEINLIDIADAKKRRQMQGPFSQQLIEKIGQTIEAGEQVILFRNRRGFAPVMECETCGHSVQCNNCDVNLTYHKYQHILRCHYCGYKQKVPQTCVACGGNNIHLKGSGTEKIEEELQLIFPKIKIGRMDWDTTRTKNAYNSIIEAFEDKEIDVLVGTQMVTKGLDFDNVGLVGVVDADGMLHFPDFRANERCFQLLTQVSGRAGRKNKKGQVLIQTNQPTAEIFKNIQANNFAAYYRQELLERKNYVYPPYSRIIHFSVKHRDVKLANEAALFLAGLLKQNKEVQTLGPEPPLIPRVRNQYIFDLMIKASKSKDLLKTKEMIKAALNEFRQQKKYSSVRVNVDVDPQ